MLLLQLVEEALHIGMPIDFPGAADQITQPFGIRFRIIDLETVQVIRGGLCLVGEQISHTQTHARDIALRAA